MRCGEKPTSYFLNLEKWSNKNKLLTTIMRDDGNLVSDPESVLSHCKDFYQILYSENPDDLLPMEDIDDLIDNVDLPSLSDTERVFMESAFTQEEFKLALDHLNKNRCPGSDGLPPEFYFYFWEHLAPYLFDSLSFSIAEGSLSSEQKRGIITLIPKKDVDRRLVSNWRPITLLNTDYKVLTKAIAIRLQKYLGKLIHQNQTGFMPGRFIGDNIRAIQDVAHIFRIHNRDGMIVSIDFSKAFDTVRWHFLFRVLKAFGFGPNFVDLIKTLFSGVESCITNGGTTSGFFKPQRGIRQGCCVSIFIPPCRRGYGRHDQTGQ